MRDIQALQEIAEDLTNLMLDPTATLHYDIMSDALVWSDERPKGRLVRELWCLRPVFRYRTGLILGLELTEFQNDWQTANQLFPLWIGFRDERSSRSVALQAEYIRLKEK
jgi:hypothetical protein